MRLYWIGIPAGLAFAASGLALFEAARGPHSATGDLEITGPPIRHFVTELMTRETLAKTEKVAPRFNVTDTQGQSLAIAPQGRDKPQFIYFVLDGCPCSYDAEPLYHDLARQFRGQVDFVSVTDAGLAKAKHWATTMTVPYPVVSDPNKVIIHAYGARNALYSALISRDGHIVKMWPGYSKDLLLEMNRRIAEEAGIAAKSFDTKFAPIEKSTGCTF